MTVLEKIHSALNWFQQNTGLEPTAVYLGYEDVFALKDDPEALTMMNVPPNKDHRIEVMGYPVYEVMTKHHLRVS